MTLVSPILIQSLMASRLDPLSPAKGITAEVTEHGIDIAVVAVEDDLYGYSLTEILVYLLERADKTDNEIADMRAGVP